MNLVEQLVSLDDNTRVVIADSNSAEHVEDPLEEEEDEEEDAMMGGSDSNEEGELVVGQ